MPSNLKPRAFSSEGVTNVDLTLGIGYLRDENQWAMRLIVTREEVGQAVDGALSAEDARSVAASLIRGAAEIERLRLTEPHGPAEGAERGQTS